MMNLNEEGFIGLEFGKLTDDDLVSYFTSLLESSEDLPIFEELFYLGDDYDCETCGFTDNHISYVVEELETEMITITARHGCYGGEYEVVPFNAVVETIKQMTDGYSSQKNAIKHASKVQKLLERISKLQVFKEFSNL